MTRHCAISTTYGSCCDGGPRISSPPYAALQYRERMRRVQRRHGFSYHSVHIHWQRVGPPLGLGIRHFQNRVLVSSTHEGSLSVAALTIGDHLIDVHGVPVSDKDVAKLGQLGATGFATSIVERPNSSAA